MSDNQTSDQQAAPQGKRSPFSEFIRHQQKAAQETGKALDSLLPPGFKEHSQEAGREFFSGVKVLFDAALDEVEKASREVDKNLKRERPAASDDDNDRPSSTGTTKVKVQVD